MNFEIAHSVDCHLSSIAGDSALFNPRSCEMLIRCELFGNVTSLKPSHLYNGSKSL